ncbi:MULTISPECIES: hypothetical protein [unclassified Arcicella]|uniref:hypothetical protein n=1 Tax=unclassified Arcicella TaxID=2644986 RepID=UPI00285DE4CC|nr:MULTISPECIES: hypothetical protein [unclassified Arcicella]MDR6564455.1 hypothetical protein [Arcicella sp. BE51]MDR6814314.1 hypothetical protein [Arcicella sp. BE140]MDR6825664.1 hypothetical protein [Arcicella sp. BE139]
MNKIEFLSKEPVQAFIKWIAPKLDGDDSFIHSYMMKRPKGSVWECNSIYSAFENYKWGFTCYHPIRQIRFTGKTFEDCKVLLEELGDGLRKSVDNNDSELCQKYCIAILDWGGVMHGNKQKVEALGADISSYLKNCTDKLNPNIFDTKGSYYEDIIMTAGFTKIYSLLVNDFVIYDGRVGAALGLLVRMFCEEKGLSIIPSELLFAFGNAKGDVYGIDNKRNPSNNLYTFPLLTQNKKHTENNIRANWLLKEILDKTESKFSKIDSREQLRAFESALFMIGYDVSQANHLKFNKATKRLPTWGGKSTFEYDGSVENGTKINFGSKNIAFVSNEQYQMLLNTFLGKTVCIGTSRTSTPSGSLGEWLINNITKTAIASYVGAILVEEGYASKNKDVIIFK